MMKKMMIVAALCAAGVTTQAMALPTVSTGTLKLHLDAGSGVATSGGQVTQWNDLSGGGSHFVQTNLLQQPALVVGLNGLPAVQFTLDRLDAIAGHTLNNANALDFTFFAVTSGGTDPLALFDSRPGQPNVFRFFGNNAMELWPSQPSLAVTTNAAGSIISTQATLAPTRMLDNRVISTGTLSATSAFFPSFTQIGFTDPDIGTINGGGNGNYSGNISELIYYQGRLSSQDQLNVEKYLRQKYNLTGNAAGQLPNPAIVAASDAFGSPGTPFGGAYDVRLVLDGNINTDYASNGAGVNTFIDFDFGGPTVISTVEYTDRTTSGAAQGAGGGGSQDNVTLYSLIFSDDAIFGNADDRTVNVASPGFANTESVVINGGFGFNARYVRWDVFASSGGATNLGAGEFRFFSNPIPEPASMSLLGLAGLALLRRRRTA